MEAESNFTNIAFNSRSWEGLYGDKLNLLDFQEQIRIDVYN